MRSLFYSVADVCIILGWAGFVLAIVTMYACIVSARLLPPDITAFTVQAAAVGCAGTIARLTAYMRTLDAAF
jgi:hypothetical protein